MLESPSNLESPRDPFTGALWWTESSFDGSPCRNGSFASVKGNLRRLKESTDRSSDPDLSLDTARKKLTWISREDHTSSSGSSSSQNLADNDRQSIQNGSMNGRSGRLGGADSPRRGIHSPAESPVRRGESVRRIRTPSIDSADTTRVPSSATASRRLRSLNHAGSASFKEGSAAAAASAVTKSDHTVVKEASTIWRGLASTAVVRDQRTAPKQRVPHRTTDEYSPESDRVVVSYLAEETDRIIKDRIAKLKQRFHFNAPDQLQTIDHNRSSVGEAMRTNGSGRWPLSRHFDNTTKAERVIETYDDMNRDQVRVGDRELDDVSSNSPSSSMPESPSLPISPLLQPYNGFSTIGEGNGPSPMLTISATMANYLDNRRRGSNMGPQIVVTPRRTTDPSLSPAALSRSNLAVLRQPADEPENPSSSSNGNQVGRHESFTASSRAALSTINGNEDVAHSTTSLSRRKGELYSTRGLRIAGEDPNIRGSQRNESTHSQKIARDSTESVEQMRQQQGENDFPSRLDHWVDFPGNGVEIESPLRQVSKQNEKRTSPSARKELGKTTASVGFQSNGARGGVHSSQTVRRQVGGSARYPAVARDLLGQSQRYEPEIGKSLLSDKVLSVGLRDKHNASRRSQSCRRDSIINSLLDSSQEDKPRTPAVSRNKTPSLPGGHETSFNSKNLNASRSAVNMRVTSSSDTLPKPSPFLSQIEKQKLLSTDLSDHGSSSRRIATAASESRAIPLSSSRRFSVAGPPASGGNPLSSSSSRPSSVGPEAAGGNPLSSSRRYSVAAGPELCRSPLVSYSQLLQGLRSPILKAKHPRMDTSSETKSGGPHMVSPIQDSQLSAKKKNALQLERPKMSHKSSVSLDQQDIYKRLFVQTKKDNQNGQPVTNSTSISQACSMPSPMTVAKPQPPPSPGSSFQRWFANQFKLGSKSRSSSMGKDRDPQGEPKPRKKSPWRTKSAEILQVITRKKGSSPRRPAVPLVDARSLPNVQQGNSFDSETSQSPMSASDPWHHRMMHIEASSTPPHRKFYVLPSISAMSPARAPSLQSQLKNHRRH